MASDPVQPEFRYPDGDRILDAGERKLGFRPQVRDENLWQSAIARPQAGFGGYEQYPTAWQKAGALMHSVAQNHALDDANKRMSWVAANELLEMNGHTLSHVSDREAERITMAVATHKLDDIDTLSQTLQSAANRSEPAQPGTAAEASRRTDRSKSVERDL
jgi:death on curing protein